MARLRVCEKMGTGTGQSSRISTSCQGRPEPVPIFSPTLSFPFFLLLCLTSLGCLTQMPETALVPANPFGHTPPSPSITTRSLAQASLEVAARVDTVGRAILQANQQLGIKPLFRTIGSSEPEIFHQGTSEIDITEGLAKQCANDGQLAAVLCQELGKMVSEREALAGPQVRLPERPAPMDVRIGNDNAGAFGPADQVRRAELAKYENERKEKAASLAPPDPLALARAYLTKAGYPATELDTVAPILRTASENHAFAKQLIAPASAKP